MTVNANFKVASSTAVFQTWVSAKSPSGTNYLNTLCQKIGTNAPTSRVTTSSAKLSVTGGGSIANYNSGTAVTASANNSKATFATATSGDWKLLTCNTIYTVGDDLNMETINSYYPKVDLKVGSTMNYWAGATQWISTSASTFSINSRLNDPAYTFTLSDSATQLALSVIVLASATSSLNF